MLRKRPVTYFYTPQPDDIEFGLCLYSSGGYYASAVYKIIDRIRTDYQLMYVIKGRGTVTQFNKTFEVKSGDVFIIYPHAIHSYKSDDEGWYANWIHFYGDLAGKLVKYIGFKEEETQLFHIGNDLNLQEHFNNIAKILSSPETGERTAVNAEINALLFTIARLKMNTGKKERNDPFHKVRRYIAEHFAERITVEELAKIAGYSRFHFLRLFRDNVGITPAEYILNSRMQAAKKMMIESDATVAECARFVGYEAPYFCRLFKKREGMTPGEFRQNQ